MTAPDAMTRDGVDFHIWWDHTDPEGDWPDAAILVRHPATGLLGTWDPDNGTVSVFPDDPEVGDTVISLPVKHEDQALSQIFHLLELVIRDNA
jgi:hypothetical protein